MLSEEQTCEVLFLGKAAWTMAILLTQKAGSHVAMITCYMTRLSGDSYRVLAL